MTVASIIEQFNTERPNQIDDGLKVDWLKKCEMMILDKVIRTHEDAPPEEELEERIENFDLYSDLIVNEPYDDLYIYYLDQRIAMNNNDMKRYNVAASLYNNAMLTYQQKYNRDHMALKPRVYTIRHEVL